MTMALYLDVLVAVLLTATIAYAFVLNRKLGRLRADREGFEKMLQKFVAATERAESGVAMLQRTADASAAELDSKRDGAVALRNDLEFLVARANEQADRLEAQISKGREQEAPRQATPRENIFDRLRKEERAERKPQDEAFRAANDAETDIDDAVTPAWLTAARKVAGASEGLR